MKYFLLVEFFLSKNVSQFDSRVLFAVRFNVPLQQQKAFLAIGLSDTRVPTFWHRIIINTQVHVLMIARVPTFI